MGRTGNVQNGTQLNGAFRYRTKPQSCLQLETVKERLYGHDRAGRIGTQNRIAKKLPHTGLRTLYGEAF